VPRVVWIALAIVMVFALLLLLDPLRIALISYAGCDVHEGNLSDCTVENGIVLPLVSLSLLWGLGVITLPLGFCALLALGVFWLATRRPSHPWWPLVLLAEAILMRLGIWVVFFI
jgi:hypothetical protein